MRYPRRKNKALFWTPYWHCVPCCLNKGSCVFILHRALHTVWLVEPLGISSSAPGHQMQALGSLGASVWPQGPSCLEKMETKTLETVGPPFQPWSLSSEAASSWASDILHPVCPHPQPHPHLGWSNLVKQATHPGRLVKCELQRNNKYIF